MRFPLRGLIRLFPKAHCIRLLESLIEQVLSSAHLDEEYVKRVRAKKQLGTIVEAMRKDKGLPITEEDKAVLILGIPQYLDKDKGEELGFYEENGQWYAVIGKPNRKTN